ncbi:MAG: GlsB/YeaQ/YmgE family stress response membrane protein [Actinomycetaceae bacterium]|nr:GlsB/YeaQ/YmgE family stress response membrane protein [Arcanobacterium sp.]MDD7504615.1 GlsB/YeaQ/YmgE family stress response membrane protein [Actinomycetaceae bacterium]MDY6143069.1 GlsB/YeaQ/YmgE family stress response membrane protein [Arcanobacterium sp.]
MQQLIGMIVVGALIGAVARLVKPGKQPIGILATIALGALGAGVGGWLVELFGYTNASGGVEWIKWIVAVVVAGILISVYMTITGSKKRGE